MGHYIEETIRSVLNQSYYDIEYIVVDGCSTDDTAYILEIYKDEIDHIVIEKDDGIYDAMNKGLELASGDIVAFINADDFYSTDTAVSEIVEIFNNSPDYSVVLTTVNYVNESNLQSVVRYYPSIFFEKWMLRIGIMPPHLGTFIKKSIYTEIGNYKSDYKIAGDFELFVRLFLKQDIPFRKVSDSFVTMRTGGTSKLTLKNFHRITCEMLRSLKENNIYSHYLFMFLRVPLKISWTFYFKFLKKK